MAGVFTIVIIVMMYQSDVATEHVSIDRHGKCFVLCCVVAFFSSLLTKSCSLSDHFLATCFISPCFYRFLVFFVNVYSY